MSLQACRSDEDRMALTPDLRIPQTESELSGRMEGWKTRPRRSPKRKILVEFSGTVDLTGDDSGRHASRPSRVGWKRSRSATCDFTGTSPAESTSSHSRDVFRNPRIRSAASRDEPRPDSPDRSSLETLKLALEDASPRRRIPPAEPETERGSRPRWMCPRRIRRRNPGLLDLSSSSDLDCVVLNRHKERFKRYKQQKILFDRLKRRHPIISERLVEIGDSMDECDNDDVECIEPKTNDVKSVEDKPKEDGVITKEPSPRKRWPDLKEDAKIIEKKEKGATKDKCEEKKDKEREVETTTPTPPKRVIVELHDLIRNEKIVELRHASMRAREIGKYRMLHGQTFIIKTIDGRDISPNAILSDFCSNDQERRIAFRMEKKYRWW